MGNPSHKMSPKPHRNSLTKKGLLSSETEVAHRAAGQSTGSIGLSRLSLSLSRPGGPSSSQACSLLCDQDSVPPTRSVCHEHSRCPLEVGRVPLSQDLLTMLVSTVGGVHPALGPSAPPPNQVGMRREQARSPIQPSPQQRAPWGGSPLFMAWEIRSPLALDPESHDPVFPALTSSPPCLPPSDLLKEAEDRNHCTDSKTKAHKVAETGCDMTLGQSLTLCGSVSPSEGKGDEIPSRALSPQAATCHLTSSPQCPA